MKFKKIVIVIGILNLIYSNNSVAQDMEKGLDVSFILGLNIGFTTPVPLPDDLDITGYNPRFNPKTGANVIWYFDEHWGIGAGLNAEWKGMNVDTKVTDVHLSVDVPQLGTLTGYVTGKNTTRVNTFYLVQPVYATYRFNPKWQVKTGIYLAEALSRKFKGDVRDVDIVVETPLSQEREIPYATLDYSDDVRKFDVGLLAGGEFKINRQFGIFADFTWGFTPYFSREVPIHFTMRNIYFSLGATYRITP